MKSLLLFCTAFLLSWAAGAQNNINGTFETWRNYTSGGKALEAPLGWYGSDSVIDAIASFAGATTQKQITKVTSSHSGTYAVQITSANYGGMFDTIPGALACARPTLNLATQNVSFSGYPTVNQRIPSMSVWIKTAPVGQDSGSVEIDMLKSGLVAADGSDSIIGSGFAEFGTVSSYTLFTIPVTYVNSTIVPDGILITFTSGASENANNPGSTMFVDDAALLTTTGIAQPLFGQPVVACYPNPGNGLFQLRTATTAPLTWQAYSVDGRLISTNVFTGEGQGDLHDQPAGLYMYRITANDGSLVQTGTLSVVR